MRRLTLTAALLSLVTFAAPARADVTVGVDIYEGAITPTMAVSHSAPGYLTAGSVIIAPADFNVLVSFKLGVQFDTSSTYRASFCPAVSPAYDKIECDQYDDTYIFSSGTVHGTSPYRAWSPTFTPNHTLLHTGQPILFFVSVILEQNSPGGGLLYQYGTAPIVSAVQGIYALNDGGDYAWQYKPWGRFAPNNTLVGSPLTPYSATFSRTSAITLSASAGATTYGQTAPFTATMTGFAGPPTGNVQLLDGTQVIATAPLNGAGLATFAPTNINVGTRTLSAQYSGGDWLPATSAPTTQTVSRGTSSVVMTSSPSPSALGDHFTLTATTSGAGAGADGGDQTGGMHFYEGTTLLCNATVSGHVASCTAPNTLALGAHTFHAVYDGDENIAGSTSADYVHTVNATAVAFQFSVTPSSVGYGDRVALRAALSGNGGMPTGQVVFKSAGVTLATANVDATGVAAMTATGAVLPVGIQALRAEYSGDGHYGASNASGTVAVTKGATSLTLSAPGTVRVGDPVTLTATLGASLPSDGDVEFFEGATSLGHATAHSGVATLTTTYATEASHAVTATYAGTTSWLPSAAPVITVNVMAVNVPIPDAGDTFVVDASAPSGTSASSGSSGGAVAAQAASSSSDSGCAVRANDSKYGAAAWVLGLPALAWILRRRKAATR